ncbi:hypothetical protein PG999_003008 [Apiospora kogelbergensis]|uniref:Uncharacterized protein n=1 Tax=Apiospora kogelbergensis TaxID=1337665 RepID=A0AAW0R9Z9_9PEZI
MLDKAREDMASGGIECRPTDNDKRHVLQAIFAVLCWTSATLKPLVGANATRPAAAAPPLHDPNTTEEGSSNASSKFTVLSAENCSRIYSSSNTRRPIGSLFHTYRSRSHAAHSREQGTLETTLGGVDTQTASSTFEDMLYEPGLTYHSLLMAGHVQIRWVDTLTAHLYFNRSTRELSVFRYPSICAARIYSVQNIKVLERCVIQLNMHLACDESPYLPEHVDVPSITEKLLPHQLTDSPDEPASIYKEVLLTYRLLFGQSQRSRKCISQLLDNATNASSAGISRRMESNDHPVLADPLLRKRSGPHIKGNIFPASALDVRNELIESGSYSARDDFPVFGPRLLSLQRYNKRRQLTKITDLWRDRRNPLQWYTFWVVTIIGGFGLIVALLQLVVGFVQMAYAIHPAAELK